MLEFSTRAVGRVSGGRRAVLNKLGSKTRRTRLALHAEMDTVGGRARKRRSGSGGFDRAMLDSRPYEDYCIQRTRISTAPFDRVLGRSVE